MPVSIHNSTTKSTKQPLHHVALTFCVLFSSFLCVKSFLIYLIFINGLNRTKKGQLFMTLFFSSFTFRCGNKKILMCFFMTIELKNVWKKFLFHSLSIKKEEKEKNVKKCDKTVENELLLWTQRNTFSVMAINFVRKAFFLVSRRLSYD